MKTLPRAQRDKMAGAILGAFFDRDTSPKLPKALNTLWRAWCPEVLKAYRGSVVGLNKDNPEVYENEMSEKEWDSEIFFSEKNSKTPVKQPNSCDPPLNPKTQEPDEPKNQLNPLPHEEEASPFEGSTISNGKPESRESTRSERAEEFDSKTVLPTLDEVTNFARQYGAEAYASVTGLDEDMAAATMANQFIARRKGEQGAQRKDWHADFIVFKKEMINTAPTQLKGGD